MSGTQVSSQQSPVAGFTATVDLKLEVVVIPVSTSIVPSAFTGTWDGGWTPISHSTTASGLSQFTPPGSGCSVQFGTRITSAAPGSAENLYLVVSDIEAARSELAGRAAEISEVFHTSSPGAQFQPEGTSGRVKGPAPEHASYSSFATFSDPDGNRWLLQEINDASSGARTQQRRRRDVDGDAARRRGASRPIRADGAEASLVGLVRRLHRRARARADS